MCCNKIFYLFLHLRCAFVSLSMSVSSQSAFLAVFKSVGCFETPVRKNCERGDDKSAHITWPSNTSVERAVVLSFSRPEDGGRGE